MHEVLLSWAYTGNTLMLNSTPNYIYEWGKEESVKSMHEAFLSWAYEYKFWLDSKYYLVTWSDSSIWLRPLFHVFYLGEKVDYAWSIKMYICYIFKIQVELTWTIREIIIILLMNIVVRFYSSMLYM